MAILTEQPTEMELLMESMLGEPWIPQQDVAVPDIVTKSTSPPVSTPTAKPLSQLQTQVQSTRAPVASQEATVDEWNALIDEKIEEGMSPTQARLAVAREQPQLRARMLRAFNSPADDKPDNREAIYEMFNDLVAAKVKAGVPNARAVVQVRDENPKLYEAMMTAHNSPEKR